MYECDECGSVRINTPSGSVCSEGCGKLWPKVPAKPMRINEALLAGLPKARSDSGKWIVDGHDCRFTPGRVYRGPVSRPSIENDEVVAIDGENLRVFKKEKELAAK